MNLINEILFNLSIFIEYKTERVVNIVWKLESREDEGYQTNSVFRASDYWHERLLIDPASNAIEISTAQASPLTCPLDKFSHEHGCYSAQ